jgi:surfactin family lipopeptide synthetase A
MIPQMLTQIDKMPMTPNGKIDKKALLSDELMSGINKGEYILPANEDEEKLYDIAKEILNIEDFGVTDDLTFSGLTSLSAIKMADQANREGLYIKVNDILRNRSIRNILINEQSIGKWENGYDANKPVLVLIQGFTNYKKLEPLISKLCECYSVFVIEPISEHYKSLFNGDIINYNNVVDFYLDFMEAYMHPAVNIEMFVGHSFGGELAYRCAVRWHQNTGYMSKVCVLDTFILYNSIVPKKPISEIGNQTTGEESDIAEVKEWYRQLQLIQSLNDDRDLPGYDGDVLYFKSEYMAPQLKAIHVNTQELNQKKQEYLNYWSTLAPRLSIYHVVADHFTMLEERFCNEYLEKINDIVLPHNS